MRRHQISLIRLFCISINFLISPSIAQDDSYESTSNWMINEVQNLIEQHNYQQAPTDQTQNDTDSPTLSEYETFACEVKLCLSTPNTPSECDEVINKYVKIPAYERDEIIKDCPQFNLTEITTNRSTNSYFATLINQLSAQLQKSQADIIANHYDEIMWLLANGYHVDLDDFKSKSYYGAIPKEYSIDFTPQPGRGSARVGFFIPTETSGLPSIPYLSPGGLYGIPSIETIRIQSKGDDRSFNPFAHESRYRAYADVNFDAGTATFHVNPSCGVRGHECHDALSIIQDFGTAGRWFQRLPFVAESNRVKMEANADGSVKIRFAIMNSDKVHIAPTIDGTITLAPSGNSNVIVQNYHRDSYPAMEIYHYPSGDPTNPIVLEQEGDAWGPGLGLSPLPFTDKDD